MPQGGIANFEIKFGPQIFIYYYKWFDYISWRLFVCQEMSWFADIIPPPHTREPLTGQSFLRDLLPPILCYYATAVLVLLPDTLFIRLALLPLTLWMVFRGATRVDLIGMFYNERFLYWNQALLLGLTTVSMRVTVWTFQQKPLRRVTVSSSTSDSQVRVDPDADVGTNSSLNAMQAANDALELCFNLRGCGWNWSTGLRVPLETRPTSSTAAFILPTFASLILDILVFDITQYFIQWLAPLTIGAPKGGTIFDPTIPFVQRYLRSCVITLFTGLAVYCAIQIAYHACTLLGVLVFRQHISLWPPIFRDPWSAPSLSELWAERWHQSFRHNFISLGGKPMAMLMGRAGGVLGAFFVSGLLHYIGLWGMGNGSDFLRVVGFFMMMAVGVIMEHTWKKFTGRKVEGVLGCIWVWIWVLGWSHILVEAWAMRGVMASAFFPSSFRPAFNIFGPLP